MIVRVMATPGKTTSHHGGRTASANTPPSMLPQLGAGGGTPTEEAQADSAKIAVPRLRLMMTSSGATHCGATC